jgi:hypothetical protein
MALFLAEQNDARELLSATQELCHLESMSWADAFGSVAKMVEPSIQQQHSILKKWWAMHVLVEQMYLNQVAASSTQVVASSPARPTVHDS